MGSHLIWSSIVLCYHEYFEEGGETMYVRERQLAIIVFSRRKTDIQHVYNLVIVVCDSLQCTVSRSYSLFP
jgi:hypothetical protein